MRTFVAIESETDSLPVGEVSSFGLRMLSSAKISKLIRAEKLYQPVTLASASRSA